MDATAIIDSLRSEELQSMLSAIDEQRGAVKALLRVVKSREAMRDTVRAQSIVAFVDEWASST